MDVLRGRQVEALLAALVLQQRTSEAIGHLDVAAVVLVRVRGGVGQQGGGLRHVGRVQERRVAVELVRLEEMNKIKLTSKLTVLQGRVKNCFCRSIF